MVRGINKLTPRTVSALSEPGRYSDGGNLYLQIAKTGGKQWTFMFSMDGRRQREMGLGGAGPGGLALAEARALADNARALLRNGVDPIENRQAHLRAKAAAETTFGKFADEYVKAHRPSWSNPKHAAQWEMTLSDAYCKGIRSLPVNRVDTEAVLRVLQPIWQRVPETARRIRMRIEKVLDAARVKDLRGGDNPARWKGHLDHLLPQHGKATKRHHAAMAFQEVPGFMAELASKSAVAAEALRFAILTAARTSEILNAEWQEFDLENGIWTLPASRMKARRVHRIPLSEQTTALVEGLRGRHAKWVFPSPDHAGPLSNMALLMLLRRMKRATVTVHGFRSSFRDWSAEATAFPREVAEMALAHTIDSDTEAAYRRGDLFDKRKKLMDAWAKFCTRVKSDNVILLNKTATQ